MFVRSSGLCSRLLSQYCQQTDLIPYLTAVLSPSVKQLLSDTLGRAQFYAHLIALALLMAASIWPEHLTRLAALAVMGSSAWLEINLIGATQRYRKALRHMASIRVVA